MTISKLIEMFWRIFGRNFPKNLKPNFLKQKLEPEREGALNSELVEIINEFESYLEFDEGYFNQKKAQAWSGKAIVIIKNGFDLLIKFRFSPELSKKWEDFQKLCHQEIELRQTYNDSYIQNEIEKFKNFFDRSGSNPLDDDQRRAVVCDEDNTLVLAGAGSGKTAVIASKVGYLVKCKTVSPEDILLLTYGKEAKKEMKRRVRDWYHIDDVECRTIHSLGYQIIAKGSKKKPRLLDEDDAPTRNSQGFLDLEIFKNLYKENKEFYKNVIQYFSGYLKPYIPEYAFESKKEWDQYVGELGDLYTLSNHKVKSFEEKVVANYLFKNGIRFEYEKPYEFPTETQDKRQYQPDFYLSDYGIYLEHFGIDKNGNPPPWFTQEEKKKYLDGKEWKFRLHKENKTNLLCTYSHQQADGILEQELEKSLKKAGVEFNEQPVDLDKLIRKTDINQFLKKILRKFTDLYKCSGNKFDDLVVKAGEGPPVYRQRNLAFLKVFKIFFEAYQATIEKEGQIDFGDMLNKSIQYVEQVFPILGLGFKYIIVDEFQDTSQGAIKLIRAIAEKNPDCHLFFVGDDWQSIYRFNGSDVGMIQNFEKRFPNNRVVEMGINYRSFQNIVELGKKFITKNPFQRSKAVRSFHETQKSNHVIKINNRSVILKFLETINRTEEGKQTSIYFLGRYNEDVPDYLLDFQKRFKGLKIEYMTIHKSKGLEADYVFVLPPKRNSFPSVIADDPVLDLVAAPRENHQFAEERRLMYVAITRARKQVFFVRPSNDKQKSFVGEIESLVASS